MRSSVSELYRFQNAWSNDKKKIFYYMALIEAPEAILEIQLNIFSFVKCSVSIKDKDVRHYN